MAAECRRRPPTSARTCRFSLRFADGFLGIIRARVGSSASKAYTEKQRPPPTANAPLFLGTWHFEETHTTDTLCRSRGRRGARTRRALPPDAHATIRALNPNFPLPKRGLARASTGQYVDGHGLIDVKWCHMAVFEGMDDGVARELRIEDPKHHSEGQGAVDQQVPIALDFAAVLGVIVDRMGVVRKSTVLE